MMGTWKKARRFSAALDGMAAGNARADPELAEDLAVAKLLFGTDPSAASGMKDMLRDRLAAMEEWTARVEPRGELRRCARFAGPACAASVIACAAVGLALLRPVPRGDTAPPGFAAAAEEPAERRELMKPVSGHREEAAPGSGLGNLSIPIRDDPAAVYKVLPRYPTFQDAQRQLRDFRLLIPTFLPDGLLLEGVSVTPGNRGCVAMFRGAAGNSLILWEAAAAVPRGLLQSLGRGGIVTVPNTAEPSEKVPLSGGTASWMKSEGYGQLSWTAGPVFCRLSGIGLGLEEALSIAGNMR